MAMEDLRNKKVLIVGLGKSGLATADFLVSRQAHVTVTDQLSASQLGSTADAAKKLGCSLALAGHPVEVFTQADLIVVSPGCGPSAAPQGHAQGITHPGVAVMRSDIAQPTTRRE